MRALILIPPDFIYDGLNPLTRTSELMWMPITGQIKAVDVHINDIIDGRIPYHAQFCVHPKPVPSFVPLDPWKDAFIEYRGLV